MATTTKTPPKPPANPVAEAAETLDTLTHKREVCVQRGVELAGERDSIALAACTGDVKAAKRMTEIHSAIAAQSSELAAFDSALKSAGEELAAAQAAEQQAADRQLAEEAKKLARELGECFPYLDRHLTEAARALIAINDGFAKLHALGFAAPSDAQLRIGIATILQSWAHRLPRSWHEQLRDGFQFLGPLQRRTAAQYWSALEASLIRQRLGEAPAPQPPTAKQTRTEAA
jgi:hypothetical protein